MARITYSEFLDWMAYLGWEEDCKTKQDFYLAQIAAEVRRTIAKNPRAVKVKDFLHATVSSAEYEDRAQKSKSAWAAALNLKLERN